MPERMIAIGKSFDLMDGFPPSLQPNRERPAGIITSLVDETGGHDESDFRIVVEPGDQQTHVVAVRKK